MAFSRFDTFCQYLEMPFILLDFILRIIGHGAQRGGLSKIYDSPQTKPTLFFVLYTLCFEPSAHLNFGL
jgi:hypothetical protein